MVGERRGEGGGGRGGGFISSSEASPHINPKLQVQASPSLSFSAYLSLNSTTCNVTKQTNQINQCRGSNVSLNFLFIYLFFIFFIFLFLFLSMVLADMFLSVLEYNLKEIAYAADVAQLAYV